VGATAGPWSFHSVIDAPYAGPQAVKVEKPFWNMGFRVDPVHEHVYYCSHDSGG